MAEIENTGAEVAEVADPQTSQTETADTTGASETENENGSGSESAEQSGNGQQDEQPGAQRPTTERDSQFAAARREAEAQARAAEQRSQAAQHTLELVQKYGAANGVYSDADVAAKFGAQGITNLEQLGAEVERQNTINQTGIDPQALQPIIDNLIQNHPAIKAVQEMEQAAREQQARSSSEKMLADFKTNFPDVPVDPSKGFEQFGDPDTMTRYLGMGLSLSEAYSLANGQALRAKSAAAAKQQAINEIGSKGHMRPTGDGVDVSNVAVPAETERMYRQWFPKWDKKKIQQEYAKSLKD